PPTQLGAGGAASRNACTAEGTPAAFARHVSGEPNALAGTGAALVALPHGALAAFAVVRPAAGQPARLVASVVDAQGRIAAARPVGEGVTRILASGSVGASAVCVVATGVAGSEAERLGVVVLGANGAA